MSTATLEGFLGRADTKERPTDVSQVPYTGTGAHLEAGQQIIRYSAVSRGASTKDGDRKSQPRVLRRLQGFLAEISGTEARVVFVEKAKQFSYSIPADQLRRIGVRVRNQPFQMDEIEISDQNGLIVGYRFQALAKVSDAYIEPLNFDAERQRKRDIVLKSFTKAKG